MLLVVYLVYGIVAVGLIGWLAHTLYGNGALFLEGVFPGQPALARAVNRLLVTGFLMLNLGWAALLLEGERPIDGTAAVEELSMRLGALLLSLGVIHFVNLAVLARVRGAERRRHEVPVRPDAWLPAR